MIKGNLNRIFITFGVFLILNYKKGDKLKTILRKHTNQLIKYY